MVDPPRTGTIGALNGNRTRPLRWTAETASRHSSANTTQYQTSAPVTKQTARTIDHTAVLLRVAG